MNIDKIRNFSIIAHIDHGKSTLADRLLEFTGTISAREMQDQFLDKMDIERERGITIKAQTVRLKYRAKDGNEYIINLIDTPGHVDFTYEVSRSLAACEGAILVVDASQGVEAQTLANTYLAIENNLEIIPVLNKIDLPNADPERIRKEIEDIIGLDASEAILASAKEGIGTEDILEAIINKIPPPKGDIDKPLKSLIFDSWYDSYQGAIILTRVFDGKIYKGMRIKLFSTGRIYEVDKVGCFGPYMYEKESLEAGEVGFIIAGIKEIKHTKVGDTITDDDNPVNEPLPGFKTIKPMVFSGLYPSESGDYELLRNALEKLQLNDSSFTYEPETSIALGFGFRCGFLGLLHMEIVKERLEREYSLNLINTVPTVVYKVEKTNGEVIFIDNPVKLPKPNEIKAIMEPYVKVTIHLPEEYIGAILSLCEERRGIQKEIRYITENRAIIIYELPLNEIITDFYDKLKSSTRGYASMDYEHLDFRRADLVRLDILINGDMIDSLSIITPREKAYYRGREIVSNMRKLIPRQLFEVVIQASIGSKVISRESISPLRKNVTAKCYGGDITRKRKLLEKQKLGKKRMKQLGKVEIPQEVFLSLLKR
jgi:GTP-binding protein LepA